MSLENLIEPIVRIEELRAALKVQRSTIENWEVAGHLPKRTAYGPGLTGWPLSQIEAWYKSRQLVGEGKDITGVKRRKNKKLDAAVAGAAETFGT
jgi:predicted DNA-binding transcriptional regulator AlpA